MCYGMVNMILYQICGLGIRDDPVDEWAALVLSAGISGETWVPFSSVRSVRYHIDTGTGTV